VVNAQLSRPSSNRNAGIFIDVFARSGRRRRLDDKKGRTGAFRFEDGLESWAFTSEVSTHTMF
jgi:hypothetical protein